MEFGMFPSTVRTDAPRNNAIWRIARSRAADASVSGLVSLSRPRVCQSSLLLIFFVPSATQSRPALSIPQAELEFFQPAICRINFGHEKTYGPNDFPVSLTTKRPTRRNASQGACQHLPEIRLDLVAIDGEEQAEDVLRTICARGAGQQFFRARWQACVIVHALCHGNVRAHTQIAAPYAFTIYTRLRSGVSATDSEPGARRPRCAGWPERVV